MSTWPRQSTRCWIEGSSPRGEEIPEQRRRLALANPGIDVGPMVHRRLAKQYRAMLDRTPLGIGGTIIEPRDTGMGDCPGAHRARLKRDPQVAVFEPLSTKMCRGGTQREDFGMGGGIVQRARRVGGRWQSPHHHAPPRRPPAPRPCQPPCAAASSAARIGAGSGNITAYMPCYAGNCQRNMAFGTLRPIGQFGQRCPPPVCSSSPSAP